MSINFADYNGRLVTSGDPNVTLPWYLVDRGKCRGVTSNLMEKLWLPNQRQNLVLLGPDDILANVGPALRDDTAIVTRQPPPDRPWYLLDDGALRGVSQQLMEYYHFKPDVEVLPPDVFDQFPPGPDLLM